MALPNRKTIRLKGYNYNLPGCYFITVCTRKKEKLLCEIVGTAVPGGPQVRFTKYGMITQQQLEEMSDFYSDVKIEKYVVMPNHIHLLIRVLPGETAVEAPTGGPPGTAVPTSKLARFVGTFKRLSEREWGQPIWQARSYDHVVRNEDDYRKIWAYIDENPAKWMEDRFYTQE